MEEIPEGDRSDYGLTAAMRVGAKNKNSVL